MVWRKLGRKFALVDKLDVTVSSPQVLERKLIAPRVLHEIRNVIEFILFTMKHSSSLTIQSLSGVAIVMNRVFKWVVNTWSGS